jgi:anti-sigma factor RsiW
MTCSEVKYVMPLYMSSELDVARMAEYELHLQQCAACRREAEQLRIYDELLREAVAEQRIDTRELRTRIWRQISASEPWLSGLSRRRVHLLSIAALLLLAIGAGIIYINRLSSNSEDLFTSAVDDHTEEVVQQAPIEGWRTSRVEIERLVNERLSNLDVINKLQPTDYALVRARVCDLAGESYVHLVYDGREREISFFVRHKDSELPGGALETVNGCPLRVQSARGLEVAGFQTEKLTVLIVSDLTRAESMRLARESAMRVA